MRGTLIAGALLGALAVAAGAFGAHALEGALDERARGWYDTAVTYHTTHALALLACGLLGAAGQARGAAGHRAARPCRIAAAAFALGVPLFSGSLYLMAFTGWTRLGIVTPFGGLALIVGWLALGVAASRLPGGPGGTGWSG